MRRFRGAAAWTTFIALISLPALAIQRESPRSRVEKKSQSELASKTSFAPISASSPELKKALEAHDVAGAKKLIGKDGAFHGTVARVFAPKSNNLVILNFDPDYKKALVAVIRAEDFAKFPRLDSLTNKPVLVKGMFVDYNGTPELSLTNASQVRIVK